MTGPVTNEKVADVLEEALERMNGGKHWLKHGYKSHQPHADGKYAYCSVGALGAAVHSGRFLGPRYLLMQKAVAALCDAYTEVNTPSEGMIINWNDSSRTTWPKVQKRFRRAITKLRKS